jgi:hypothetical protein
MEEVWQGIQGFEKKLHTGLQILEDLAMAISSTITGDSVYYLQGWRVCGSRAKDQQHQVDTDQGDVFIQLVHIKSGTQG